MISNGRALMGATLEQVFRDIYNNASVAAGLLEQ